MSGSGREALPDVRAWLGGPPECLGVSVKPSRIFESDQKVLPDGRDALLNIWEWSSGPPGCPGVVGSPSRTFGSGREDLPDVQKW